VAGHLDERALQLVRPPQLLVGLLELLVLRLQLLHQPLALGDQLVALRRLTDHRLQLLGLPRLGDVAVDVALVDGVDDGADVGVAGHQQPDGVGELLAQPAEELHAGHLRHALVGEDDVDRLLVDELERVGGAGGAQDLVVEAQQVLDALDDVGLVVDDQEGVLARGHIF
jgi:hypothetical protein